MIYIYFDGSCQPRNPGGVASYGFAIYRDNEVIKRGHGIAGEGERMTNNYAEFSAISMAIKWLNDEGITDDVIIRGDSNLVIKQLSGKWKVKSDTSKKFVSVIKSMLIGRKCKFEWISREKNKEADELSRVAYNMYAFGESDLNEVS